MKKAFTSDWQAGAGKTMSMDDFLKGLSPAERKKIVTIDPEKEFNLLKKDFYFGDDRNAT